MSRREFITLVVGVLVSWAPAVRSQQPAIPVIGFIVTGASAEVAHLVTAFRDGLKEVGYVEGQNVLIEYRWAENQHGRLPALAADLVHRKVAIIIATGGARSWMPVMAATTTIPIVLQGGGDPIKLGLIDDFSRPGGNATGVVNISAELIAKRLEILRELVPNATMIAVLTNRDNPSAESQLKDVAAAGRAMQQEIYVVNSSSDRDIDEAFATLVQHRAGALLVTADPFFTNRRERLVALAVRHALPAIYPFSEFTAVGGLISYGASLGDEWRKAGIYAGRILNGAKPADLPVLQPTKFELVINLKTAKALGITIPPMLLARADEVIE